MSSSSLWFHCRSLLVHVSRQVKGGTLKKIALEKEAWMVKEVSIGNMFSQACPSFLSFFFS